MQLDFNEEINPATFTPSEVTLTGPGGTIAGVTVAAVAGSNDHEFTISFPDQTAAGTYTLKVGPDIQDWYGNDMNQNRNGVNGEAADAFVETIRQTAAGSTDLLSITGIPAAVTAGTSETFTVTALSPGGGTDTSFLGTIEFTSTDSQAVLPASYTFTAANAGTHTFTVTFKTAGPESITATDTANSAIIGTEDNIIVQAAAAKLAEGHRLPDHRHRRDGGDIQRHRLRCLRQCGHGIHGHAGIHQQRPPGDPPGEVHHDPRGSGDLQLHRHAHDGGHPVDHCDRHANVEHQGHRVEIVVQAASPVAGRHRLPHQRHGRCVR